MALVNRRGWRFNSQATPLHTLQSCSITGSTETPFKPNSALGIYQCHGLWAEEDASREDDGNDEGLCFGAVLILSGGRISYLGA
jgi:hypothetical protein